MKELNTKYEHKKIEAGKYQQWLDAGYFKAGIHPDRIPFTLVIPPPNVTGALHLGHALDNTLEDMVCRYKRLRGYDVLWVPGMDHAGIATQAKVDALLKEQGISRFDIGREAFLEHAWAWKHEYAQRIREQWAKLGLSVDYTRERFTLDEGLNEAVRKVFVDLYHEGLIYQGERIINWDVQAKTALSNIEVIHKEIEGSFYYFRYPVVGEDRQLLVATTRPETMFGDVCVVVNPNDERYQDLIGKYVINPANDQPLVVIADEYVELGFGTGAMKCTPAHDPNDFALAEKHHLDKILCMHPDGTMNEICGKYEGMDRFACREALVEDIKAKGLCEKIEKHVHPVGHSERTDTIIEPYLSKQWFVKMKPLAQDVLDHQADPKSKIDFFPSRFEHIFAQWLENIEDWCISRQLWWGHRIPAWYHKQTGEIYVGMDEPKDPENYIQDEDVLDTWFSSALWPFTTLGWPEKTADYQRYYPTDTMVTGYDIIFFWVARMAFQARHFTKDRPFKEVLIHGLIRDEKGRKMSKSLGNGVDPLDVIDKYGVDALRFFITTNSTPGQDMRYIEEKVEAAWNFLNKIFNAARFVLINLPKDFKPLPISNLKLAKADKWILYRFNEMLANITPNLDKYEFALAGNAVKQFVWDEFCSWYIDLSKATLYGKDEEAKAVTCSVLYTLLKDIVKILHPYVPFITEEIWSCLPETDGACCISSWPVSYPDTSKKEADQMDRMISLITTLREIKVDYNLKPGSALSGYVSDENDRMIPFDHEETLILERMSKLSLLSNKPQGEPIVRVILGGFIVIPADELVDLKQERAKLNEQKEALEKELKRSEAMLNNQSFLSKAPEAKIAEEKEKAETYKQQYALVLEQIEKLG